MRQLSARNLRNIGTGIVLSILWSSGPCFAGVLAFIHPKKNYVIVETEKWERRVEFSVMCFFTVEGEKKGCGTVALIRKSKIVVDVTPELRNSLTQGMPVARAKENQRVSPKVLSRVLKKFPSPQQGTPSEEELPESSGSWTFSGSLGFQVRHFYETTEYPDQLTTQTTLWAQVQQKYTSNDNQQFVTLTPYVRKDSTDAGRDLFDLQEFEWNGVTERSELRVGVRQVFWGVVESQHLVDIINQTDLAGSYEGDRKLGQPMVNFAWFDSWGNLDFYILPIFRSRTFPGKKGRLQGPNTVEVKKPLYESSEGAKHVDAALRYSVSGFGVDLGLSYFSGTGRDPDFILQPDTSGTLQVRPYYYLLQQTGLELQITAGGFLIKGEAVNRNRKSKSYQAWTYGTEYTFNGIYDTAVDYGFIVEHSRDSRNIDGNSFMQNDVFIGNKIALNNFSSLEFIVGTFFDLNYKTSVYSLESSGRILDSWKWGLMARGFSEVDPKDPLYAIENDDYGQLELAYYF